MLDAQDFGSVLEPRFWEPLVGSLIGAGVALTGGAAIAWLLVAVFKRWAASTLTPLDDMVVKGLSSPLRWLLPVLSLFLAVPELDLREGSKASVRHWLAVSMTLIVSWAFFRAIQLFEDIVARHKTATGSLQARRHFAQVHGLSNVVRFLVGLATAGLVLLSFAGVRELGVSMLASAGVAGIVIGFAAQKTLSAVVSGLVIAVAQPIRIDDAVVVEGELGIVEEIGLTFVVVRLLDRRCFVLPIGYFLERPFQNWSRSSTQVRSGVDLYLDYSASLEPIREELRKILEASPNWDRDFWELGVTGTSERGMIVRASMSAADARKAATLRGEVREKLLVAIQTRWPSAFPRLRTDATQSTPDP